MSDSDMVEVRTTSCPNCGAKVEITGATHATECPFCDTLVVLDTGTERQINAYDDVITIVSADASHARLRLPYGTRGVGTTTGGPDVIRHWLKGLTGH